MRLAVGDKSAVQQFPGPVRTRHTAAIMPAVHDSAVTMDMPAILSAVIMACARPHRAGLAVSIMIVGVPELSAVANGRSPT